VTRDRPEARGDSDPLTREFLPFRRVRFNSGVRCVPTYVASPPRHARGGDTMTLTRG